MRETTNIKAPENSQTTSATGKNQSEFLETSPNEIKLNENLDLEDSDRLTQKMSLMDLIQQDTLNSLTEWAKSSGLINTTTSDISEAGVSNDPITTNNTDGKGAETSQPLAFVSDALNERPGISSRLLETLILGGGMLYGLNRATNNGVSKWFKRLLPAGSGSFLIGGVYERVIAVFRIEEKQGIDRLVAAKITDERLVILAEQHLPMDLEAASMKSNIDLHYELGKLVKKVTNHTGRKGDFLLYDPCLRNELDIYEDLGEKNEELKPQRLQKILSKLKDNELIQLEQWLKAPSKSKNNVHPVKEHLLKRQKELRKMLNHEKSILVSILELSLAMNIKAKT